MAQRRREATIHDLSDDVLRRVFSLIPLNTRQQRLVLVCKRWSELCTSPGLLQRVEIRISAEESRIFQLGCMWLAQHAAGSVRDLDLYATWPFEYDADMHDVTANSFALSSMLAACTHLTRLELSGPVEISGDWPAGALPRLEELRCSLAMHPEGLWLPKSLTRLHHFRVVRTEFDANDLQVDTDLVPPLSEVPALPNMRDLEVHASSNIDCSGLAVMTGLERLCMTEAAPRATTLAKLTALTELTCRPPLDGHEELLRALPGLSSLRSLVLKGSNPSLKLRGGDWLARLQRLEANAAAVADVLQHADSLAQLQHLHVSRTAGTTFFESIRQVLLRARGVPTLSHLFLVSLPDMDGWEAQWYSRALLALQRSNPSLAIEFF